MTEVRSAGCEMRLYALRVHCVSVFKVVLPPATPSPPGFLFFRGERVGVRGAQAGFTLMEVMVALIVVAIALLAVYRMHSQTLFMDYQSRFDTTATLLARQKLTEMEDAKALSELTTDEGTFGDDYPGYAWKMEGEVLTSDLFRADGPVLKRISLTIRHEPDGLAFTMVTYRHLYE